MAAIVLSVYAWGKFNDLPSTDSLIVSEAAAILAGITIVASVVAYIAPIKKVLSASLAIYGLLLLMVIWLIMETGAVHSPFIALWMLSAAFAGLYGWVMVGPLGFLVIGYIVISVVSDGQLDQNDNLPALIIGGLLPLGLGMLIWYRNPTVERVKVKLAEANTTELHKVTNQSEIVINAIGDGVLAIDSQGIVRLINPAAQTIIGWSGKDAVTLDYKAVLQLATDDGQEIPMHLDPILQGLNTNQQYRTSDISILTSSGKRLLISIVVSPIGDPGDGVIVTFRDVTKEKAEEREQAEFISTASHEMRTPVASIEGYLGLALNPATAQIDDKARSYIEKAHEATQHLGRLFQDLLDISKSEDGRLTSNPQLIDVAKFTDDIIMGLKPQADQKGIHLGFKPSSKGASEKQLHPVYHISQDKDHLREVISNLTENAIKYTHTGEVLIDVTGDDGEVVISVKDSGIGIPAEDIPHLFQKFYRVDNSDTREINGTGLGLYLCRRLVESMNGRIWVESQYKSGSTFFVAIPRLTRAEADKLASEQPAEPQSAPEAAKQPAFEPQAPPPPPPTLSEIEQNPELYRQQMTQSHPRGRPAGGPIIRPRE